MDDENLIKTAGGRTRYKKGRKTIDEEEIILFKTSVNGRRSVHLLVKHCLNLIMSAIRARATTV